MNQPEKFLTWGLILLLFALFIATILLGSVIALSKDNLKARLALSGVEASISSVEVADKGLLHRVRIGPYSKPEDIARVKAMLKQDGFNPVVVKAD